MFNLQPRLFKPGSPASEPNVCSLDVSPLVNQSFLEEKNKLGSSDLITGFI